MSDAPAPVTQNGPEEQAGHKVFAGNLAYSTTDEGLKAFFAPVQADVISAQIILRGTRSAGYGFVGFSTAEAAEKAVALLNKKELDGREVIIEVAKAQDQKDKEKTEKKANKRAGRRAGKAPPGEVTEAEANGDVPTKSEGAKTEGDATAKPKKKKAPRKKKSKTEDGTPAADGAPVTDGAAVAENGDKLEKAKKAKTPKQPRKARPPRPTGEAPEGEPSKTMLFVANLGFNVDETALTDIFTTAGLPVNSARIIRRRWQPRKSKGYGFVDVGSEENQKKAIELLNNTTVAGREIAIKIAVDSQLKAEEAEDNKESTPEAVIITA